MIKSYLTFICILYLFIPTFLNAQDFVPKKVLFVGNSYTYFWNLPQQVTRLAKEGNIDLVTKQSTIGGANLGQHWRSDRNLKTVQLIKEEGFDAVVFQDHSLRAIQHPDSLMLFGEKLASLAKEHGAKVYVYMTWAREFDPFMQHEITAGYEQLAKRIDAIVVPVGLAWERARKMRPDINLYDADGSHPSTTGSYLSACVFYAKLTGKSPVGLPSRLISKDIDGEKLYLNIIPGGDAQFCQKIAEEIVFNE